MTLARTEEVLADIVKLSVRLRVPVDMHYRLTPSLGSEPVVEVQVSVHGSMTPTEARAYLRGMRDERMLATGNALEPDTGQ